MHCRHGRVSSQIVPYLVQLSHFESAPRSGLADLLAGSGSLLLGLADVGAADILEVGAPGFTR